MLAQLRRGAGSFIAKIFIFLLVASFAVWGVADIFRTTGDTAVARVGDTEVSIERYRQELQQEIQLFSRQSGTYLTMDQARALGLDSRVLGRLMAEAALNDEADRRNLNIPDAVVAESIREEATFQAPGGQFDRSYFDQYLRSIGYSEAAFVAEQRQRLLRRAIGEAVGGAPAAPDTLAAAFNRYINETRSAEFVVVSADQVASLTTPDEDTLRSYYQEHQAEFTAPEYRTVGLLTATPETLASQVEVTDEDLQAAFEARRNQFAAPEQRTIEQISFDSIEEAQAAYEAIQGGKSFEQVAQEAGLGEADIALGTLTRDQVVDPQVAEVAFSLAEGEVSDPVQGQFTPVLLRVSEVQEGTDPTLEEVAPQVRQALAAERAHDRILDIYDEVEDDRASGMTLQEIAAARGLDYREVTTDQAGRSPEGEQVTLPQANDLLGGIFASDVGIETDPVETADEGYVWYALQEIVPSRQLEFEEAHDQVAEAWRREQSQEQVRARADELLTRLRGGATLQEIAQEVGTQVETIGPVRRTQETERFGEAALGLMFTTPEGEFAETSGAGPGERIIFRVTDVTVPEYQANPEGQLEQQLEAAMANDLLGQYVSGLEEELGARVSQEGLARALGDTAS